MGWGGIERSNVAQDRFQWRALVNTIVNLHVPKNVWASLEYLHNWQLVKDWAPWSV
jgi:hypothetical protein